LNNAVNRVSDVVQTAVPAITNSINETSKNVFGSPWLWIAGGIAVVVIGPAIMKKVL